MITKEQYQRIKKHFSSKKYDEKEFMNLLWNIDCPAMLEELTPNQWKKMDRQNYLRLVKLYPSYLKENEWIFTPGHRLMILLSNCYNTDYEAISDIEGITTEDIIAVGKGFGLKDVCETLIKMPRKITANDIKAIAKENMWSVLREIPTMTKKCTKTLFDKCLREEIERYESNDLGKRTSLYMYMTKLMPEEVQQLVDEPCLGERIDIVADNIKPKEMFGLLGKCRISANACAKQLEHAYLYNALYHHMCYPQCLPDYYDVRGKTQEDIELVEKLNNYLLMIDAPTMMEKQKCIREWMKQTLPELTKE